MKVSNHDQPLTKLATICHHCIKFMLHYLDADSRAGVNYFSEFLLHIFDANSRTVVKN